jgi:hypothetical protein
MRPYSPTDIGDAYWSKDEQHFISTINKILPKERKTETEFWDIDVGSALGRKK